MHSRFITIRGCAVFPSILPLLDRYFYLDVLPFPAFFLNSFETTAHKWRKCTRNFLAALVRRYNGRVNFAAGASGSARKICLTVASYSAALGTFRAMRDEDVDELISLL